MKSRPPICVSSLQIKEEELEQELRKSRTTLLSLQDVFGVFRKMGIPENYFYFLVQKLLERNILSKMEGFILEKKE
ncbi:MAG: hypothetical protein IPN70_04990 [Candidatus Moraniibacteriota bacterium]|nr:MAG: hypothetical protein IPN70_04990 [Candidatus Moranbacteria bacterium]